MVIIYGADTSKKITPEIVRDAMVDCFYKAHCVDSSLFETSEFNKVYCEQTIRTMFEESGDDFEKPSKESIIRVIQKLKEFSTNFRDSKFFEKKYG